MKQSTAELLGKLFASLCVVAGAVALVLGFWWMVWLLWCFVLPQVYPTGPEAWDVTFEGKVAKPITGKAAVAVQSFHVTELEVVE